MGWSKRQIVEDAFGELALAGYTFDLDPQELQAALRRLDLLMASLAGHGINLGYSIGLSPTESDLDQDSGLPLFCVRAVVLMLAREIASSKGKQLSPITLRNCKEAYDLLITKLAKDAVQEQQLRADTPLGAGHRQVLVTEPNTDPLKVSSNGGLDFSGN